MNRLEEGTPKRYRLPRWLKLAMGDYGALRVAHVKDGKLYATDGHMLLVFGGFEEMPDGGVSFAAVNFLGSKRLEFTATDKRLRVEEHKGEAVEFERPGIMPPNFEKALKPAKEPGPFVRIAISADILLNAVLAARWDTGAGNKVVKLDIPVEYLKTGASNAPWKVENSCSQAEQILFMPCRLEPVEARENMKAIRQALAEGEKEDVKEGAE